MRAGTLGAFREPNYSIYFTGRVISSTGTWFQTLALSLVVLNATGSAQALSGVSVAQFLPMLVLSVPAGRLADRVHPRTILLVTSSLSALVVAGLALIVGASEPEIGLIYALAAALGCLTTFERIAEQTMVYELVGPELLTAGISANSIAASAARSIGPGIAGIAFQSLGPTACMLLNAASFLMVLVSVACIRPARMHARGVVVEAEAALAAPGVVPAFRIRASRGLVVLLVVNVVVSVLALNLLVVLTAVADVTFEADAVGVGAVHMANAVGSIIGGLIVGSRKTRAFRSLILACAALGFALLLCAAAPTLALFLAAGPLLGIAFTYYNGMVQTVAQSHVPPALIGRIVSLVSLGHLGMIPVGALIAGFVTDRMGGQFMMLIGGVAALACAVAVALLVPRSYEGSH